MQSKTKRLHIFVMEETTVHKELVESLRRGWELLDVDIISPLLADDLHYYSWWAMVEFNCKEDYLSYIRERFQTYKKTGVHPIVKIGVNKNDGECAVALQYSDDVPTLIRIKEEAGKISEMWIQPAE